MPCLGNWLNAFGYYFQYISLAAERARFLLNWIKFEPLTYFETLRILGYYYSSFVYLLGCTYTIRAYESECWHIIFHLRLFARHVFFLRKSAVIGNCTPRQLQPTWINKARIYDLYTYRLGQLIVKNLRSAIVILYYMHFCIKWS